ncbi:unnamed protein product, partial [Rotaria magnacalcarata]
HNLRTWLYVGGRVYTVEAVPDIFVDLGAQYILNDSSDIVFQFFDKLKSLTDKKDKVDFFLTSKRERIDAKLVQRVWNSRLEVLAEINETGTENSLLERYIQRLSSFVDDDALRSTFIDWLLKVVDAGGWSSISDDWRQSKCSFRPLTNHLLSTIPNNQIRLNTEVTKVKYSPGSHMLTAELNHGSDKTATSSITCDHVIWTTSLGYLKKNFSSIFASESDLIDQKQQAITNLSFCTTNKVILIYENTIDFWPANAADIYLLHDRNAPIKFNDEQLEFLATHNVDSKVAQLILNTLFYVAPSHEYRVLTCWFGGRAALLAENISEIVLGRLCHDTLWQYLAGVDKNKRPVHTIRSEWSSNRFMCGSYSSFLPQTSQVDQEKLRESFAPDGVPRIMFVGESTHPVFLATVHGAHETGVEAAQTLIERYNCLHG